MAIPPEDYENERVGGALLMASIAVDRVHQMLEAGCSPAETQHAIETAEQAISTGREMIRGEDVSLERKDETLTWMDELENELQGCRPAISTH